MRYDSIKRHEGGPIEKVGGAPVLGSIALRNLNRLLAPLDCWLQFRFAERTTVSLTLGLSGMEPGGSGAYTLQVPLRIVNRLLRPFGVLFFALQPDDPKDDVWISLVRDRYPQKPTRA